MILVSSGFLLFSVKKGPFSLVIHFDHSKKTICKMKLSKLLSILYQISNLYEQINKVKHSIEYLLQNQEYLCLEGI